MFRVSSLGPDQVVIKHHLSKGALIFSFKMVTLFFFRHSWEGDPTSISQCFLQMVIRGGRAVSAASVIPDTWKSSPSSLDSRIFFVVCASFSPLPEREPSADSCYLLVASPLPCAPPRPLQLTCPAARQEAIPAVTCTVSKALPSPSSCRLQQEGEVLPKEGTDQQGSVQKLESRSFWL